MANQALIMATLYDNQDNIILSYSNILANEKPRPAGLAGRGAG